MFAQDHAKKIEKFENQVKKKHNLEELYYEIQEARDKAKKLQKKTHKKKKIGLKKSSKQGISVSKIPQQGTSPADQIEANVLSFKDDDDENNYSLLYNEYKKIIQNKQAARAVSSGNVQIGPISSSEHTNAEIEQPHMDPAQIEVRKEEVKKKFFDLTNRYQKNLNSIIHNLESRSEQRQESLDQGSKNSGQKNSRNYENPAGGIRQNNNVYLKDYAVEDDQSDPEMIRREGEHQEGDETPNEQEGFPEDTYHEIIEAAAIFIQKNFRGYRTRKLLRDYFMRLCDEDMELDGQEGYTPSEEEEKRQ